jgi:RNA polymerase sigma factor (sigma-70 family)
MAYYPTETAPSKQESQTIENPTEGVGFEPTQGLRPGGLARRCLQPLGHPSWVLSDLSNFSWNHRLSGKMRPSRRERGQSLNRRRKCDQVRGLGRLASAAICLPTNGCGERLRPHSPLVHEKPMNELSFADLMGRVREGDEAATNEIMQRYGAEVRRIARVRLRHGKLRRVLESSDILQSVMGSFFRRADHGEYEDRLSTPDELLKLLATMVRFKVIDQVRRASSDRRGGKFDVVELIDSAIAPSSDLSPDQQLIQSELIGLVKDVMTTEEWELWRLRHGDNLEWAEIAQKCGGSAESNRKKLERLQERLRAKFADREGE